MQRKVNVKSNGQDDLYMNNDLTQDKLCQLIDQFSERNIDHRDFYFVLLDIIHPFSDRNGKDVRYYLFAISVRGYNFNKAASIVNKGI